MKLLISTPVPSVCTTSHPISSEGRSDYSLLELHSSLAGRKACHHRDVRRDARVIQIGKTAQTFGPQKAVVVLDVFVEIKERQKLCGEDKDRAQEKFKPLFSFSSAYLSVLAYRLHYKGGFINAQ